MNGRCRSVRHALAHGGTPTQRYLAGACSLLLVLSSAFAFGSAVAKHRRPPTASLMRYIDLQLLTIILSEVSAAPQLSS